MDEVEQGAVVQQIPLVCRLPEQLLSDLRLDADVFLRFAVKGELEIHDCLGVLVSRKAVTLVVRDLVHISLHQYSALILRKLFHGPFTLSLNN